MTRTGKLYIARLVYSELQSVFFMDMGSSAKAFPGTVNIKQMECSVYMAETFFALLLISALLKGDSLCQKG